MKRFWTIVARDLALAVRIGGGGVHAVSFFILVILVFALAVGPDLNLLSALAAPVIWVGAVLATQISLDRMFQADFEDGSLDVLLTSDLPLEVVVLAKCLAHWLTTGLPLLIVTPLAGLMLNLDGDALGVLTLSLAIGTPALSLIGAIGAALTVALRRGGLLMSLLVAPLYVPILIFGVSMGAPAGEGGSVAGLLLGALSLFCLVISPVASAAALRQNAF